VSNVHHVALHEQLVSLHLIICERFGLLNLKGLGAPIHSPRHGDLRGHLPAAALFWKFFARKATSRMRMRQMHPPHVPHRTHHLPHLNLPPWCWSSRRASVASGIRATASAIGAHGGRRLPTTDTVPARSSPAAPSGYVCSSALVRYSSPGLDQLPSTTSSDLRAAIVPVSSPAGMQNILVLTSWWPSAQRVVVVVISTDSEPLGLFVRSMRLT
jgi:hypothetical protein